MFDPVRNFAKVVVASGYDASALSVGLYTNDGAKLPDPSTEGAFNLVWWNGSDYPDPSDDPSIEIVRCTARSTDTLTIVRAQEGTAAETHNTGGKTYIMCVTVTKKLIDDLNIKLPGMLKADRTTADPATGKWIHFDTPYYSDTNYKFFPFGYTASNLVLVNIGDALSGTKTISGIWVYPAGAETTTVDWITLGS
jgi:hypothetical protein